jgi:hypothetical protein
VLADRKLHTNETVTQPHSIPFWWQSLPEIDTLLKKIQGIKKDEYKEALGELADEVDRLRDELRELEASHAAHKQ